jgi:hypothetical protein
MNRRQLLQAFAGMALGPSPLVCAASFPRFRDDKSVAIIGIGNPGIYTVANVLAMLPVPIPSIGVGTHHGGYLDHVRADFDRVHCLDSDCLSGYGEPIPCSTVHERAWKEVRAQLPKERRWLIVGSLSGETGSALIPLISREARQSGRRAHVFAMGPCLGESESSFELAERTRLEVERWAADCVIVPSTDFFDLDFQERDRKCLAWAQAFALEAGSMAWSMSSA